MIARNEEHCGLRRRFQFPEGSRRQFSLALSVLVLLLGAGYTYYRVMPDCCAPPMPTIAPEAIQQFRNTCVKEARHANGGGDLVMDDQTEAKIGAYCGCVSDALMAKVSPTEIASIADGTASTETLQRLDAIVGNCRSTLQQE
jgi:hypothetical protein